MKWRAADERNGVRTEAGAVEKQASGESRPDIFAGVLAQVSPTGRRRSVLAQHRRGGIALRLP